MMVLVDNMLVIMMVMAVDMVVIMIVLVKRNRPYKKSKTKYGPGSMQQMTPLGTESPPNHDIMTWMVEHAASIYRRVTVGSDGKTPVERLRGRRGRDLVAEFAEHVHYIPLRGDVAAKRFAKIDLEPRFLSGVFLGHRSER